MDVVKILLFLIIMVIIIMIVEFILRKILKIKKEKRKIFSYNHITDNHRKIDWGLKIVLAITLLITLYYIDGYPTTPSLYLALIPTSILVVLNFLLQAYYEWKHSQHPKESIITISSMLC